MSNESEDDGMKLYMASIDRAVHHAKIEWEYNRDVAVQGMHPAARKFLMEQWESEKKT